MVNNLLQGILEDIQKESLDGSRTVSKQEAGQTYLNYLRDELKMNLDEMEGILKEDGNMVIASCAGSGKTTSLVHKINYDWITGALGTDNTIPRVWLCTFLNKGAVDLRKNMAKVCEGYAEYARKRGIKYTYCMPSKTGISTMHAEFLRVVQSIEGKVDIISDSDNRRLLASVLKEQDIKYKGRAETSNVVDDFLTALSFTRNRVDESRYDVPLYRSLKVKRSSVDLILTSWKHKRMMANKYDFEDLEEKIYEECKQGNREYLDAITNKYDYFYIDEFQDTSQIQYEIIKLYTKKAKKVLVIGDDDQTIYTWRGSSGDILRERFREDFNPIVKTLSVNYRCPANILNPVIGSITKNKKRMDKEIRAYKDGGDFRVLTYDDYSDMASGLIENVKEDYNKGTGKIAILCRTNTDAILPTLELLKAGLDFTVSKEAMTLKTRIGRSALGVFKLFLDRGSSDALTTLKLYEPKEPQIAEHLISICRNHNIVLWDLDEEELKDSSSVLYKTVARWIRWKKELTDRECLLRIFDDFIDNVFVRKTQYNIELAGVFKAIKEIIKESEYYQVGDIYDEVRVLYQLLLARVKGVSEEKRIEIATVHEYKGAEVENVYIWNDTRGMFPHLKGGEVQTEDTYEEERRIHYIACTRAKEKSAIMTIRGNMGDFLFEMTSATSRGRVRGKI